MTQFDLVRQKVTTDPSQRNVLEHFRERLITGGYFAEELTEDKIINHFVEFCIEREENSNDRHRSPERSEWLKLHSLQVEYYVEVLWVVLEGYFGCTFLNPTQRRELEQRFASLYQDVISS